MASHRFIPAYAGNIKTYATLDDTQTVHPRICGEHYNVKLATKFVVGSSPHMRGTCPKRNHPCGKGRFIPAYAGNMETTRPAIGKTAVHPRICGEHAIDGVTQVIDTGSSPHMRGTCKLAFQSPEILRFIPAYAGNIWSLRLVCSKSAVHPRICGEHKKVVDRKFSINGSSPHMRGTYFF